jgi:hypothetical protein
MNNETWITRDGTKMTVNDMTEGHAKNALCMLIRKMRELEPGESERREQEHLESEAYMDHMHGEAGR